MTTKATARSSPVPAPVPPPSDSWYTSPLTIEDWLVRIRALGQRIDGHVQSICSVGSLNGTSQEAKERAVTAFYECLQILERKLGRIQDDLRLE